MDYPKSEIRNPKSNEGLLEALRRRVRGRVLVLGVGNELRGDDGAGLAVVRALQPEVDALDCGEVPECYLDEIRRRAPDCLLIVDAVDFGAMPGSAVVLDNEQLSRQASVGTHRASLRVLADYVRAEMGAEAVLLGIQPRTVEWGAAMSAEVVEASQAMARVLGLVSDEWQSTGWCVSTDDGSRLTTHVASEMSYVQSRE